MRGDEPIDRRRDLTPDEQKLAVAAGLLVVGLLALLLVSNDGGSNDEVRQARPARANTSHYEHRSSSELKPVPARKQPGRGENASTYASGGGSGGTKKGGGGGWFSRFSTWEPSRPCTPQINADRDFDEQVKRYGGLRMFAPEKEDNCGKTAAR